MTAADPARISRVARSGLVLDVRDEGPLDGPIAVLLHGFPQHSAAWDEVAPRLHRLGLRTLAPDQRGYSPGARPTRRRDYRMAELVDDVAAVVAASRTGGGVDRGVHLVGHDWGAAVAWATAQSRPDLVRSLVSVSIPHPRAFVTAALTSSQAWHSWYMGAFQLPGLAERALDPAHPSGRRRLVRMLVDTGLDPARAERDADFLSTPGAFTAALGWYRALPLQRPGEGGGSVRVPTALLWSDADVAITRAGIDRTPRYVDAPFRLDVLPGVGHWIPELAPVAVADAVAHVVAQA